MKSGGDNFEPNRTIGYIFGNFPDLKQIAEGKWHGFCSLGTDFVFQDELCVLSFIFQKWKYALRYLLILLALMVSAPQALAASANVKFSGYVPCRMGAENCGYDPDPRYVFSQTVGLEYFIMNDGRSSKLVRPFVNNPKARAKIIPPVQNLAVGETGRFVVLLPLKTGEDRRIEICSTVAGISEQACRLYRAVSMR